MASLALAAASYCYLFGHFTHAILYLTLAKWTAVFFSLKMNSQMKAILGSILSIPGLCFIPAMVMVVPMLLNGTNPDDAGLQIWFLTSPASVFAFNETQDFTAMAHSAWWPHSEYYTLCANLMIYGTLTLVVRAYVTRKLPELLNRRDSESSDRRDRQTEDFSEQHVTVADTVAI